MSVENINTLVVGAGQAGIAMSEHLSLMGVPHVVLERSRIAERWRSERWDSLVANGPAWHDRFPSMKFAGISPVAPGPPGVEVLKVERHVGRPGFQVTTSQGIIDATNVVAATGPFQRPAVPTLVNPQVAVEQLHSSAYKNPGQLAPGAVLVVGAGASGSQIAEELQRAGRQVYLSVGEHYRPPRAYRGRDYCWWLGALGLWDEVRITPKKKHVAFAVSGYEGGKTVDFRRLAQQGITLVGLTQSCVDGVVTFAPGLAANIAEGDRAYFEVLRDADAYIEQNGLPFPPEPAAWELLPDPACLTEPVMHLDLANAGITTIIWATGFKFDFAWLQVNAFDDQGEPFHKRGICAESGIYFLGLPNLVNRASSFIYGVWHDAKYIADHIALQNEYKAYERS
jgi:putative flavoprotein involved in K+ transport